MDRNVSGSCELSEMTEPLLCFVADNAHGCNGQNRRAGVSMGWHSVRLCAPLCCAPPKPETLKQACRWAGSRRQRGARWTPSARSSRARG